MSAQSAFGPWLEVYYEDPLIPSPEHFPLVTRAQIDMVISIARKSAGRGDWRVLGWGNGGTEIFLACVGRTRKTLVYTTTPIKIVRVNVEGSGYVVGIDSMSVRGNFSMDKIHNMNMESCVFTDKIRKFFFPHGPEGFYFCNVIRGTSVTVCRKGMYQTKEVSPIQVGEVVDAMLNL